MRSILAAANQKINYMKKVELMFIAVILASCNMDNNNSKTKEPSENKITNEYAKVAKMQGLYVFIESSPAREYETLGQVTTEDYVSQVEASNKNKKALKAGLDMLLTTVKNIKYSEKLDMLVSNAKEQYHGKVQGIIVNGNLKSCEAIKFKIE